ncbi:CPBP family intramembrane glutamic endopeptidase [Microbispora triticiradicis]|uniref:CPBP family intramembrane metalloprotease n=2 Tax=Microbispora TaxID=2005 RepID=A0ABY3M5B5_9ACTN|nr:MULTISPECIES: type II CAAX endopeptidase family protein [Microbispora]TLP66634.1 CPBP family intramembrane metalloprotease [Microbispora fusca]TYB67550.1 CPBP family intramembrane metalloprotease [Microbispora tritici]GLW25548.1 CAAX amino protease [Microbispora amethystogenes]
MRLLKQLVPVALVAFAGGAIVGAVQGSPFLVLVLGVATAALAVFVYARVVRWSERRAPVEVAGEGAVAAVGRGLLIGVGMFAAVIVNIAFLGGYRVDGLGSVTGAVGQVGFMAAAAVTEELIFRGILFRIVEGRTGTWIALVLTGLVFGLMHLTNEHASLWGAIAIAIEAGGMLAAAYAATRTLWVPIGVHFGWNFAAAGIFGTEVSGNGATQGLLHGVTSGPALLTGGDFGPEASPYAVVFGLLLTLVFMWLAHRRGNVVPLRRGATATLAQ